MLPIFSTYSIAPVFRALAASVGVEHLFDTTQVPARSRQKPRLNAGRNTGLTIVASLVMLCLSACGESKDNQPAEGPQSSTGAGSPTNPGSPSGVDANPCPQDWNGAPCSHQGGEFCFKGQCVPHRCGDGIKSSKEACDDGNNQDGDGCQSDCRLPSRCGNGLVEAGEACDEGAANGGPEVGCSQGCQWVAVCGNGKLESGEQCDDGNRINGDACSASCTHEYCGNGRKEGQEECDDGNRVSLDGCSQYCRRERCGDGILQVTLGEACDDGNQVSGDGCDARCALESRCGDGRLDPPQEICDDGNNLDGDGCSADCKLENGYCGDGIAQEMEACDDGNHLDGDGCSQLCQYEDEEPECLPHESEPLPARTSVINGDPPPAQFIYTTAMFTRYKSLCGGCHVEANQGNFQTKAGTMEFVSKEFQGHKEAILRTMHSETAHEIMPPGGKPISTLSESAPAVVLASQLEAWYDQGRSPDGFYWQGAALPEHEGYRIDDKLSASLTNVGSCQPQAKLIGRDQHNSQRLDAFFAKTDHWPELLSDTDFVSMDSKALAKAGVISYATTYELWADNAKKMRHFKLPHGTKIRFNEEKQLFELPENTRVYKTFLKEVRDLTGKVSYRKMETRVILVRKDEILPDGTAKVRALFGSYKWNADETQATLSNTPLRNGKPFTDDIFIFDIDEKEADRIRRELPPGGTFFNALLLAKKPYVRHYAIPGSQRCVECHLGSLEQNFVVGFSPLQLLRRPAGVGGVIEDKVYPGELGQLQRFVDWGLFENFSDLGKVKLLESRQSPSYWSGHDSVSPDQVEKNKRLNAKNPELEPKPVKPLLSGSRGYRNRYELELQGYALGNCAHCHNPRGFPSIREPSLAQRLNMHPLTPGGGLFEFRMDNMSPRNERGGDKRIPIPYVSPSLYDLHVPDGNKKGGSDAGFRSVDEPAPWRSLIYRNIDTPYTYVFHKTVYPHMPVHTPGYDCRTRDIFAKWMLSMPARLKGEPDPDAPTLDPDLLPRGKMSDPQPWEEVYPGDSDYDRAVLGGHLRVDAFLAGSRSTRSCKNLDADGKVNSDGDGFSVEDFNIIASSVLRGITSEPLKSGSMIVEPHFAPYDMTALPPPWDPRRADWRSALVEHVAPDGAKDEQVLVKEVLPGLRLDEGIKALGLRERPIGFWQEKPECSFEKDKRIADLAPAEKMHWMKGVSEKEQGARPLYYESAGATLFKSVCAQCHGRKGDSKGLMANLLNELTGGESRVADFNTGLFGPVKQRGAFMKRVFKEEADKAGLSVDDLAAQYMTWMSLGGTRSRIHSAVLSIVNATTLMGHSRPASTASTDANMLNIAKEICGSFVNLSMHKPSVHRLDLMQLPVLEPDEKDKTRYATYPLIQSTADAEMWVKICTYNNPMPVQILGPEIPKDQVIVLPSWMKRRVGDSKQHLSVSGGVKLLSSRAGYVKREKAMGETMLVHDGLGMNPRVEKLSPESTFALCVRRPPEEHVEEVLERLKDRAVDGKPVPLCPESWMPGSLGFSTFDAGKPGYEYVMSEDELRQWALRGAANAGLMLYAFTKELIEGKVELPADYNHCEEREGSPARIR